MSAPALQPRPARKRLPPEERRAQLLAIAIDVFAARGIGAARHAEIARRARGSVSTVLREIGALPAEERALAGQAANKWGARLEDIVRARKQALTPYFMSGFGKYGELLETLGEFKTGKSCLYIKKLDKINLPTLRKLIRASVAHTKKSNS